MKFITYLSLWMVALLALTAAPAHAEPTVEQTIAYLIKYTADSRLTFIRNGSEHTSVEAAKLMQKKFDYAKSEIHSAEDFIRLAASKSHLSGKPYLVKTADGKSIPSADWLTAALREYRAQAK